MLHKSTDNINNKVYILFNTKKRYLAHPLKRWLQLPLCSDTCTRWGKGPN
ncbi:hypothetical protein Hanom_Chr03g00278011 [Helianthus anomalus]